MYRVRGKFTYEYLYIQNRKLRWNKNRISIIEINIFNKLLEWSIFIFENQLFNKKYVNSVLSTSKFLSCTRGQVLQGKLHGITM